MFAIFSVLFCLVSGLKTTLHYKDDYLTFTRSLEGTGFKRDLKTHIQIHDSSITHLNITERVPKEWFVDQEEVPIDLLSIFPSMIDIEKPVSSSKDHMFYLWLDVSNGEVKYSYPIHTRYNEPQYNRDSVGIVVGGPVILTSGGVKIEIPGELEGEMPVGRLEDVNMVLWVTMCISVGVGVWLMMSIIQGDAYRKKQG